MNKVIVALIFLLLAAGRPARAQQDSITVSLLTCAPGTEIYQLFGHTALRCQLPSRGQDLVFNYGMFDFNTPNFVFRFVKGETDYQLGVTTFDRFVMQYARRGSEVYEQVLNLSLKEKQRLLDLLEENYLPQNRTYRYNYFYDNCTTRARDRIEECVDGRIIFPKGKEGLSYRDIVHQYTEGHEWDELGIDLCLGSEADKPIDGRQQMFAPFYLKEAVRRGAIVEGDTIRQLMMGEAKIVRVRGAVAEKGFPLSPMTCALILLAVSCLMAAWQMRRGRVLWLWDIVLFGAQGLAGCIIAFLVFFSIHPTVGSNWLILLLNPIPLIYLPFMVWRAVKGRKDLFHAIHAVYLILFMIIMPFLPQEFHATIVPLALSLLVCSASHLYIYYRQGKQ